MIIRTNIKHIEVNILRLYFLMLILEGPIRYICVMLGISWAVYIKDALLVTVFGLYAIAGIKARYIVCIAVLLGYSVYGSIILKSASQPAFALLKNYLPFFVGVALGEALRDEELYKKFIAALRRMFALSIFGLFLNFFVEYPWTRMEYRISSFEFVIARGLRIHGVRRLEGFMRSSADFSTMIAVFGFMIISHEKSRSKRFIYYALMLLCAYLSTTKGTILALVVIYALIAFYINNKQLRSVKEKIVIRAIGVVMVTLPLISNQFKLLLKLLISFGKKNRKMYLVLSAIERMTYVWPKTISIIKDNGNMVFGRGIGGIGSAQHLTENYLYTPCDNSFLFLLGTFGMVGVFLVYLLIRRADVLIDNSDRSLAYQGMIRIIEFVLLYGIIGAIEESPIIVIIIGAIIEYSFVPQESCEKVAAASNA